MHSAQPAVRWPVSFATVVMGLLFFWGAGNVIGFDFDALTAGQLPPGVAVEAAKPEVAVLRVVREYAPALRLEVREPGDWRLALGTLAVEPGRDYTLAVSLVSAAKAPKSKTQDVALFRPENQADAPEAADAGRGMAELRVAAAGTPPAAAPIARLAVNPGPWRVITLHFTAPAGVSRITAELRGAKGGLFFIADVTLAPGTGTPPIRTPAPESFELLTNLRHAEFATVITPEKPFGFYRPGETVTWRVGPGWPAPFQSFQYTIRDAWGAILRRGTGTVPQAVSFQPEAPGYYELIITSTAAGDAAPGRSDYQGAAVMPSTPEWPAGGHPFGTQSADPGLARLLGASWARGGVYGPWDREITETPADWDVSITIKSFTDNRLMPLHSSNNIAGKSNAFPPGGVNELPKDVDAYGAAYAKLVRLGGGFVQNFEFWNEPEGRLGASPAWTAENFTRALRSAHRGMKSANPAAKMAVGSNLELIANVHRFGGQDAYEIMVLHPYPWAVGSMWNTPEEGLLLELCASTRRWLDAHGGRDKEIWSTEYGYTTGTTICGCTELQQAQMDTRATLLQLAGGLSRVNPFRMDDVWFWGQVDGRFGLTRGNSTPKPAFVAYGTLLRAVKNLPYRGRLDAGPNLAALVFGNEQETVLVLWTDRGEKSVAVRLPVAGTRTELFGRTAALPAGTATLPVSESVQYLALPCPWPAAAHTQPNRFLPGITDGIFTPSALRRRSWDVPVLKAAPVVDGMPGEWSGPAITFNNPAENYRAEIRTAIASGQLYLMAKVRGDVPGRNPRTGNGLWNGDGIELYFTPAAAGRAVGYYRENDFHIGLAPGVDGKTAQIANLLAGSPPEIPGATGRYRQTPGGGYDLEAAIPLAFFGVKAAKPGDRFGFDLQLGVGNAQNPEQTRRAQDTWSGNGQDSLSPFLWGEAVVKAAPAPWLGCTQGVWPAALTNSPLQTVAVKPDRPRFELTAANAYAVTGAWIDNWHTFVRQEADGLVFGGAAPHDSAAMIWKLQAPAGNRFTGGEIEAELTLDPPAAPAKVVLAVGTRLELVGGGNRWAVFHGFNRAAFACRTATAVTGRQTIKIPLPAGAETVFVAFAREPDKTAASQATLHRLEANVALADRHAITLRFDRAEPLWTQGEPVRFQLNATGQPAPAHSRWRLTRRDGTLCRDETLALPGGTGVLNLDAAQPGMYTLSVADARHPGHVLDTQELVILRAQDPAVTPETGIFGVLGSDLALAARLGAKWCVMAHQWAWNQAGAGEPVTPPDAAIFGQARKLGLEPILLTDTCPGWANGGKDAVTPPLPAFYPQFETFNETVARTLAGQVTWFQAWNEPNNPSGLHVSSWEKALPTAQELQRHQYAGLKRGNPNAKLIGGCFAGVPLDWLEKWLSGPGSLRRFQDAVSAHPYCEALEKENWQHKRPPEPTLFKELLGARDIMNRNGAASQPLFWTEFGWDTQYTSDDDQARWIARHMIIMQALKDRVGTRADCLFGFDNNSTYSIFRPAQEVRPGGHRFRPAVAAYATVAAVLNGSTPGRAVADHPGPVYAYRFTKNGTTIYAVWSAETAERHDLTLPVTAPTVFRRLSLLGDESTVTVAPGTPLPLPANHDPFFLISP